MAPARRLRVSMLSWNVWYVKKLFISLYIPDLVPSTVQSQVTHPAPAPPAPRFDPLEQAARMGEIGRQIAALDYPGARRGPAGGRGGGGVAAALNPKCLPAQHNYRRYRSLALRTFDADVLMFQASSSWI